MPAELLKRLILGAKVAVFGPTAKPAMVSEATLIGSLSTRNANEKYTSPDVVVPIGRRVTLLIPLTVVRLPTGSGMPAGTFRLPSWFVGPIPLVVNQPPCPASTEP